MQLLGCRSSGPTHLTEIPAQIRPADELLIERAITMLQGKWRIAILCQLRNGPIRVGELKRRISPVSKKVLNQHLRRMEKDGILVRTELKGKIPHVEYALTHPLGTSILDLLEAIGKWRVQNVRG